MVTAATAMTDVVGVIQATLPTWTSIADTTDGSKKRCSWSSQTAGIVNATFSTRFTVARTQVQPPSR